MESMITDLQFNDVFNAFSDESKRTLQRLENIEFFELGEVSAKTECPSCAQILAGRNLVLLLRSMLTAVR